jgi:low affinity Fe/Cu permease
MWEHLLQLAVTLVGVFGSTTAWKFWERRLAMKAKEDSEVRKSEREDHVTVRDDLRERVTSLEAKLEAEYREKVDLLKMMADLKAEVAVLRTKLEMMTMRGNH